MKYKPELGWIGNLDRAFAELTKTNNNVFNAGHIAMRMESVVTAQMGGFPTEQIAEQHRKALQMFAASLTDEQALEVAAIYDPWCANKSYTTGEFVTYGTNAVGDPQLYKVVQSHTSQLDWLPDQTASLYSPVGLGDSGHPVWSRPTGAHDAYNEGDVVDYNGVLYRSKMNGNTFSPEEYPAGWELYAKEE